MVPKSSETVFGWDTWLKIPVRSSTPPPAIVPPSTPVQIQLYWDPPIRLGAVNPVKKPVERWAVSSRNTRWLPAKILKGRLSNVPRIVFGLPKLPPICQKFDALSPPTAAAFTLLNPPPSPVKLLAGLLNVLAPE